MAIFGGTAQPNIEKLAAKHDIKGLLKALSYEGEYEEAIHHQAVQALGQLKAQQAVEPLLAMLSDSDLPITMRILIIHTLGQIGTATAVETLASMLKDKRAEVHNAAAQALGTIGSPEAIEPLIAAIKQWKEHIAETAFTALMRIGSHVYGEQRTELANALIPMLTGTPPIVRQGAMATLDQLGWKPERNTAGARYLIARDDWENCVAIGGPAVQPLIDVLSDDDIERRQAAFTAVVHIGTPAVEPLINAMDSEHPAHQAAFWALVKIGVPAVDQLLPMLRSDQPALRESSARVLGQIGDQRALKLLVDATSDEHWAVREAAGKALVKFGKPALGALVAALHSPHDDIRWIASGGLEQLGWQPDRSEGGVRYCIARGLWDQCAAMGDIAVPTLIASLQHWDDDVRKGAAYALAKVGAPATEPLIQVLQGDHPHAREAAARTLGQIGSRQAMQPLANALQDEYAEIRLAAIGALLRLHAPGVILVPALKNEEPGVRKAAAWALGRSGEAQAVKPLVMALQDSDTEVRTVVVKALGELGNEHALQPLLALMNDPDAGVRAAVTQATEQIGQRTTT
jgi:HEAT repeat protein